MKVRTAQEMEEERVRTLYIRLPHQIKNMDDIRDLIFGDVEIKLPRQSGRHCHIIFPSVEEKLKNMKALKKKLIDNKHIFLSHAKVKELDVKLEKRKKLKKVKSVVIDKPKDEEKVTKICFLHNIPNAASVKELKALFPEAKNVAILYKQRLKNHIEGRTGIIKFRDLHTAAAYLKKERPMPLCRGIQLEIHRDKRRQKRRKKAESLKIYGVDKDEGEAKNEAIKSASEDEVKSESEEEDDVEEVQSPGEPDSEGSSEEE
ncbi:uncharacterized protein [Fopius arisanus]|uniref:Uncharacterized protein n=1 Tax=Fopius arisanus TaxID=64838 RepID=A0A9R1TAQ9_9HYME|nr:PREDICTED: uncharacterized protein LOC105268063 [Fopius arisanus]